MKTKETYINEAEARSLLELWYSAEINPVDEAALIQWFATTPSDQIPDDMRADAEILQALAGGTITEVQVTEGAAAFESKLSKVAHTGNLRFAAWMSAAAMIAVIVVSAVTFISRDTNLSDTPILTATVTPPTDTSYTYLAAIQSDTVVKTTVPHVSYVSGAITGSEDAENISVEEAQQAIKKMYAMLNKAEVQSSLDKAFGLLNKGVETSQKCLSGSEETLTRIDNTIQDAFEKTGTIRQ